LVIPDRRTSKRNLRSRATILSSGATLLRRTLSEILEAKQAKAISLSVCRRVRLFYPDRIAYHFGIGVHLLLAFLLPSACPSRTVFPWWLAYQSIEISGETASGPQQAMGSAWVGIASAGGSSLTVLEFE